MVRVRRLVIGVMLVLMSLVATLAIPVRTWRTGRMPVPPLTLTAPDGERLPPRRIWGIRTPAADTHRTLMSTIVSPSGSWQ